LREAERTASAEGGDKHGLAEMAQKLETALKRVAPESLAIEKKDSKRTNHSRQVC
jgi:hypothetical protein